MCEEFISIKTARDLLEALQDAPDYMLDYPLTFITGDGDSEFDVAHLEIVDIISDGNRETLMRLAGAEPNYDEDE